MKLLLPWHKRIMQFPSSIALDKSHAKKRHEKEREQCLAYSSAVVFSLFRMGTSLKSQHKIWNLHLSAQYERVVVE